MRQKTNNADSSGFLGSISSNFLRSISSSNRKPTSSNPKPPKSDTENTPPTTHPNIPINLHHQSKPNDPFSHSNSHVKVVVRIRPENSNGKEGDLKIKKVSSDALCVGDRKFTFDEVFDANSNQEDVFQSVGVPLVRNALAGYNTTILSYGQSGSGKTYTMWGPPSAMADESSLSSQQGIVPRIIRMLFSELERERLVSDQKQFNYQCRCSFLEIYNEQIGNLLNPIQQNLEMKDDSSNALYIENLIEEYITNYDDVAQILNKGLSRRKNEAMNLNSNSSRSHIIFTFVIESLCKGTTKGFSTSKTSRIILIDIAGLDRDEVDDGGSQCPRESRHVDKSLSQLKHLVDALTNKSQSGKKEDIPRSDSCLTRLLQESLGGNGKLSVICSISLDNKSNDATLQTLRFGEQVRSIRNEPVINVVKETDADLSNNIRHLKEELIRAKDDVHSSAGSKDGYFQEHNMRESLNLMRVSLNHSLLLSNIDNDTDEHVNVNEDDIRKLRQQIDELDNSSEGNPKDISVDEDCVQFYSDEEYCDADTNSCDEVEKADVYCGKTLSNPSVATESSFRDSISLNSCNHSATLAGPQLSESPKFSKTQRRSVAISSSYLGSWNNVAESSTFSNKVLRKSFKQGDHVQSSLQSSKAKSLAASLQKGLQIIDYHQQNSALNKSSTSFSFEHLTLTPCLDIDKDDSYDQTIQQKPSSDEVTAAFLCASCWAKISNEDSSKAQAGNPDGMTDKIPKHLENVIAKSIMKEKELENVCKEQAARIEQLNQLVEKLKGEKELDSITMYNSMKDEEKLLRGISSSGHLPCIIEENCEVKEVQEELAQSDVSFDSTEKESLLKEIQNLRSKLQLCSDAPVKKSTEKLRSSLVSRSIQLQKSGVFSYDNGNEDLENERQRWTEMESEWICLTDELRADLESYRQLTERLEMELKLEKKSSAEMDDALKRAVMGHARMVEHYADLQEKYDDLVTKHDATMEGIAEVKKAAAKASKKGHARFAKSLSAELSALRVERERESKLLKKENQSLKIQLRDTAEAVQAAGELLVRLREAEHAAAAAEENFANLQQDNENLKMQIAKMKRKHKTEINTMKQYITESKLPESALQPLYREEDSDVAHNATSSYTYDDQAWRAEFGAIYQEHY
ncbi:kinesin-like protein KIN-12F [Glycine soja]|uniref:Kinesin-like protein KIN-12F isoform A n=1 Tax=Glycine soja TaxID=3848 RepID=A0A445FQP2_GLYSO|nr:kinesin-like protein KIN-12F [Glycine soja]RZB51211.1 Kinesin-like protein KIN-12F isoform A [Glycine soja]